MAYEDTHPHLESSECSVWIGGRTMIDITESIQPLLALLCPALGSILILIFGKRPNVREAWTLLASFFQFLIIFSMVPTILDGKRVACYLFTMFPGIDFGFRVDAFGLLFALTASSLWILVSIYSIGYMRALKEHAQTRFYFCFALAILGAVGVALSGNLVTMYIFYEILTVSTYPLVAHEQNSEALFAGRKYLAYLLTGGCFLLGAIVLTYSIAETTDFRPGGILTGDDGFSLHVYYPVYPFYNRIHESGLHAFSFLAPNSDGSPNPGQCVAPCGRCREGWCFWGCQDRSLYLWSRFDARTRTRCLACFLCRIYDDCRFSVCDRPRQSEKKAGLLHDQSTLISLSSA